jgi:argininosuccinate lyase
VDELAIARPTAFKLDGSLEFVYFNYAAEVIKRLGRDIG